MAEEGAAVLVTGRDEGRGQAVAETISAAGGTARFQPLDVTDEAAWQETVESVVSEHGRLDILFNNAGTTRAEPIADVTLETWRRIMAVNADGVFLGTRTAISAMRRSGGGSIVNMSSVLGNGRHGASRGLYGVEGVRSATSPSVWRLNAPATAAASASTRSTPPSSRRP